MLTWLSSYLIDFDFAEYKYKDIRGRITPEFNLAEISGGWE